MFKQRRAQRGFTLIELMIAVAVVAILAAVAYPAYTSAMVKNRRAAAQVVLADIAQRQQQFLLDNRQFAATTAALGITVSSEVSSYYTIAIDGTQVAATPPAWSATATPVAGKTQVSDGTLTINSTGARLPVGKW